jgi:hypothetical protein
MWKDVYGNVGGSALLDEKAIFSRGHAHVEFVADGTGHIQYMHLRASSFSTGDEVEKSRSCL